MSGASYYAFFTCVMLVAALLFLPVARCYKVADHVPGRVRIGDESSDEPERGDARATGAGAGGEDALPPPAGTPAESSPKQAELTRIRRQL